MILFCACDLVFQDWINILTLIVLAITAYLVYETLNSQKQDANFRIIFPEIKDLKDSIDNFSYQDLKATEAINRLTARIYVGALAAADRPTLIQEIKQFSPFVLKFYRIFYLLNNLKTSDKHYAFLTNDISIIYRVNFQFIFQTMRGRADMEGVIDMSTLEGNMDQVKKQFEKIENQIAAYERKNTSN